MNLVFVSPIRAVSPRMYALSVDSNLYTDGANANNATLNRVRSRPGMERITCSSRLNSFSPSFFGNLRHDIPLPSSLQFSERRLMLYGIYTIEQCDGDTCATKRETCKSMSPQKGGSGDEHGHGNHR